LKKIEEDKKKKKKFRMVRSMIEEQPEIPEGKHNSNISEQDRSENS
jgi:hypothetical protein